MRSAFIAAACLSLAACSTPYGPRGLAGGYTETQLAGNVYTVAFNGNGFTNGDTVWNYWIYRCAELTKLKGYTAFTLVRTDKTSAAPAAGDMQKSDWLPRQDGEAPSLVPVVMIYHTVTTYSASAQVTMYREPYPYSTNPLLNAQSVIDSLKPYIEKTEKVAPPRRTILEKAFILPSMTL